MRTKIFWLLLWACGAVLALQAQELSVTFTIHSEDPIVLPGGFNDWDGKYTDPGAVLYHDGQFHMFRNGFKGWPASVQIGYLTSPDGVTWTEFSEEPILFTKDVPFAKVAALASSVLVLEDGTWVMYFYTWNTFTFPGEAEIGRATADNPQGPWTVDPEPVLKRGSAGSWDSTHVDAPSVVKTDDGYLMLYSGADDSTTRLGMATSPDGITWTKYDDPTTTDAAYAESDPIYATSKESFRAHQPRLEKIGDQYVMIYRVTQRGGRNMGLELATSTDGIVWETRTAEPFWTAEAMPQGQAFWFTATTYHEDTFYLYIEGNYNTNTAIYVATAENFTLE
jgi:predicted GH43/DUF377 family glycosyl hydrolase